MTVQQSYRSDPTCRALQFFTDGEQAKWCGRFDRTGQARILVCRRSFRAFNSTGRLRPMQYVNFRCFHDAGNGIVINE